MRRNVPKAPLEQPRRQINCLALHQQAGTTGLECHARTINELVLQDAVVKAINQMLGDKSNYQAQLQLNIAAVIRASQATAIDSIDEKLMALQKS